MTSHRIKDRRKPARSGVLASVSGIAVTFRIIARAGLRLMNDLVRANESAAFYSGHLGQSPLVLKQVEPHYFKCRVSRSC